MLCYPEDQFTKELEATEQELDGVDLVKVRTIGIPFISNCIQLHAEIL